MIEEGTKSRTYAEIGDTTMQDLKWFLTFLHRNFKECKHYNAM